MELQYAELKKKFYQQLPENFKRGFAAIEALNVGYGGQAAVCQAFKIDPRTVKRGKEELESEQCFEKGRVRRSGGGRKKVSDNQEIRDKFEAEITDYEAGDPQDDTLKWLGRLPGQLFKHPSIAAMHLSIYLIKKLLTSLNFKKRSYSKKIPLGSVEDRDKQFRKISDLKKQFASKKCPIFSIDTKNKELLGLFGRGGKFFGKDPRAVKDHDFPSSSDGKVVPHGLYDITRNVGYITLGISHDTSQFVCDNLLYFWKEYLSAEYPQADSLLLLCDGGGSNSCRCHIVKEDLFKLSCMLGINIVIAHYPAYCSKWNPIEHRLFCHLHRSFEGAIFDSVETVRDLALKTSTRTGLRVEVRINRGEYKTGRAYSKTFKENKSQYIVEDAEIPQWNYTMLYTELSEVIF